jgi:hypothetical protein
MHSEEVFVEIGLEAKGNMAKQVYGAALALAIERTCAPSIGKRTPSRPMK